VRAQVSFERDEQAKQRDAVAETRNRSATSSTRPTEGFPDARPGRRVRAASSLTFSERVCASGVL
jgi:hypothetical protein